MSLLTDLITNLHHHTIVEHEPFTHAVCQPFWPADFYQALLDHFPPDDAFVVRGSRVAVDGGYGKGLTRMLTYTNRLANPDWNMAMDALETPEFSETLAKILHINLPLIFSPRVLLHKDSDGYMIRPHRDVAAKCISYICHFPQDENHRHLGTILMEPRGGVPTQERSEHMGWELFQAVKMLPYTGNCLNFWGPTANSYHAIQIIFASYDAIQYRRTARGFTFDTSFPLPYVFQCDEEERRGTAV